MGVSMPLTSVEVKIKKINVRERSVKPVSDRVVVESPVYVYVNGHHVATLFCLPTLLRELGVGWLLSQSIVKSLNEITNVTVRKNHVRIVCSSKIETRIKASKTTRIVDSSCGSTEEDFFFLIDRMTKPLVKSDYRVEAEKVLGFVRVLNEKSSLFKLTGGTHSAAIFHEGKLAAFAEDVGRHNAVDKTIGAAAFKKVDFSNCVMTSSGRQPANMVLKAARVGIPIIASIAGPVSSGIDAARRTGVTLICFVRGERMNVYSYPERINGPQNPAC